MKKSLSDYDICFDMIYFIFSFNHISDQLETLKIAKSKLKKGGKIFMILINANDMLYKKNIIPEYTDFRICKEFLVMHSSKSIELFLKKAKFKKIKIFYRQRYNISNLFKWLFKKDPNLLIQIEKTDLSKTDQVYKNYLEKNQCSDTLVVEASS